MKVLALTEPHTYAFLDLILEAFGVDRTAFAHEVHPQEDYVLQSRTHPIFVVADGVTLVPGPDGAYPNPSGAGEVARIFCETAIREAERRYGLWGAESMREVFQEANAAVGEYNWSHGRHRGNINFWDYDLFAATAAVAVMKDGVLHWGSICDSYVAYVSPEGATEFVSPDCAHPTKTHHHIPMPEEKVARAKKVKEIFRNGVDEDGKPMGYGVITGEDAALLYLNRGTHPVASGGVLLVFTDGYEHYIALQEFIELFRAWPENLGSKLKLLTLEKSQEDMMKYGRERSIIAVRIETGDAHAQGR